jgi:uncharacterized DUF497 family protein
MDAELFSCTNILDRLAISVHENYMKIVWDEPKRRQNLAKHRMDFADLKPEFFEAARIETAKQDRFLAVGELAGVTVIAVVFRPLGSQAVSVVSMRRASKSERSKP